ncbi:Chitin deacetylase-like protein 9 [Colletotrichum sojae]|uniref:Chitin deacetylase-like protein 9 n=1 Tax=Colletotrichum sojae TaxID=2175907 RepID=A0A8H6JYH9_9PEZI|nr:Chitin deacetylase-like protein 9 [Colletotrichum sojae]
MRWSPLLLTTLAGLETVVAHEGPHVNIVLGRRGPEELRKKRAAYEVFNPPSVPLKPRADESHPLEARQTGLTQALPSGIALGDNVNCGPGFGACAAGFCCSSAGWCGKGTDYCRAPDCQISYGPGCDGNQRPNGPDTSNDARPKRGSVPYGGLGIYACNNDGDVAVTYDDGPYIYTNAMLDAFKAHGAVATWYITGNNIGKGQINVAYRDVIQRMVAEGHQIASHTWSHENLDQMTLSQRKNQMVYNEIAFTDILGFYPTYMRPPFSICGAECQGQMADLGYHITYFDLDTQGYLHTEPSRIQVSLDLWDAAMLARSPCNASYLHIEHDIHEQVATTFTNHMLDSIVANGWRAVTVGECLGDPPENWYRRSNYAYNFNITAVTPPVCSSTPTSTASSSGTSTSTSASATSTGIIISLDARCGGTTRQTCAGSTFGNCCSVNGWCGTGTNYCGSGCQSQFGTCGSQGLSSSSVSGATARGSTSSSSTGSSSRSSGSSSSARTSSSSTRATGSSASTSRPVSTSGSSSRSSTGTSRPASASGSTSRPSTSGSVTAASGTSVGLSGTSRLGTATGTSAAASASSTLLTSLNGECGGTNGRTCIGYVGGNCCSQYNFCGVSVDHCGTGCQPLFGNCTSSSSSASGSSSVPAGSGTATSVRSVPVSAAGSASASVPASASTSIPASASAPGAGTSTAATAAAPSSSLTSLNGECGANGRTCIGYSGGSCCSQYNYCGVTPQHCGVGCQPGFGNCTSSGSSSVAAAASSGGVVAPSVSPSGTAGGNTPTTASNPPAASNSNPSRDGSCGGTNRYNCQGTGYGDCCSTWGFCGNTTDHCDSGCQGSFGRCSSTTVNLNVSLDGKCGSNNGAETCSGSVFGNCCSQWGFCGSSTVHCGTGCQSGFGTCGMSTEVNGAGSTTSQPTSSVLSPANTLSQATKSSTSLSRPFTPSSSPVGNSVRGSSSSTSTTTTATSSVRLSSSGSSKASSTTISTTAKLTTTTSRSSTAAAPPGQTAKPIKTVNKAGDSCGDASRQKCGTGLCCTSRGVCAETKVWLFTNGNCYAFNGCKPAWGNCL